MFVSKLIRDRLDFLKMDNFKYDYVDMINYLSGNDSVHSVWLTFEDKNIEIYKPKYSGSLKHSNEMYLMYCVNNGEMNEVKLMTEKTEKEDREKCVSVIIEKLLNL